MNAPVETSVGMEATFLVALVAAAEEAEALPEPELVAAAVVREEEEEVAASASAVAFRLPHCLAAVQAS